MAHVSETFILGLVLLLVLLALDGTAARWGEDSRHEYEDRNW